MNCKMIRRWIPGYVSSELTASLCWIVEHHVKGCEKCAGELESFYLLSDWIRDARRLPEPICTVSWEGVKAKISISPKTYKPSFLRHSWPLIPVALGAITFMMSHVFAPLTPMDNQAGPNAPVKSAASPAPKDPLIDLVDPSPIVGSFISSEADNDSSQPVEVKHIHENSYHRTAHNYRQTSEQDKPKVRTAVPIKSAVIKSTPKKSDTPAAPKRKVTEITPEGSGSGENQAIDHNSDEVSWNY